MGLTSQDGTRETFNKAGSRGGGDLYANFDEFHFISQWMNWSIWEVFSDSSCSVLHWNKKQINSVSWTFRLQNFTNYILLFGNVFKYGSLVARSYCFDYAQRVTWSRTWFGLQTLCLNHFPTFLYFQLILFWSRAGPPYKPTKGLLRCQWPPGGPKLTYRMIHWLNMAS